MSPKTPKSNIGQGEKRPFGPFVTVESVHFGNQECLLTVPIIFGPLAIDDDDLRLARHDYTPLIGWAVIVCQVKPYFRGFKNLPASGIGG